MIETERLVLREWRDADRAPLAAMGRDPEAMRHLGPLQTRAEADAAIDRMIALQKARGHCFWPIERRDDGVLLGHCGLKLAPAGIPGVTGSIEIGWRLRRDVWRQGYAREAAQACLEWGWANLAVDRIVAITTPGNTASWGLMERLGMIRRHDLDFGHPMLPIGDPLRPHITYEALRP